MCGVREGSEGSGWGGVEGSEGREGARGWREYCWAWWALGRAAVFEKMKASCLLRVGYEGWGRVGLGKGNGG